ncbi:MAG TPA: BatD family protein, partial [Candidatus Eisenbacteria bacterium]
MIRVALRWMVLVVALVAMAGLAVPGARAADVGVEAEVDRTEVAIDGQVTYSITVSGGLRQLPTPELPTLEADWTVYSAGTSRNFSFINGQVSSSATFRYILTPRRPGKLTIGKASVKIGNTVYQTEPVVITVGATAGGGGGRGSSGGGAASADAVEGVGKDLFVTASVDKKNP